MSALVLTLVLTVLGFAVAVFVFNFFAGLVKGKPDFSRAFAAVSLAAIPAWVAGIVGALVPWIGLLISLAGGIVSLVFLYKIMPLALEVPQEKRVVHYVGSLVAIFVINMVLAMAIGLDRMGADLSNYDYSSNDAGKSTPVASGMFGELERQGRLMDAAASDTYDPPADGELTEDQVEYFVSVMRKAQAARDDYSKQMQKLAAEVEDQQKAGEVTSPADLARMYQGVGNAMGANNAEMEIVKTGGGNWAEYQWVKEQLRVARLQQGEGSDAIEHNYELYEEFEDELEELQ